MNESRRGLVLLLICGVGAISLAAADSASAASQFVLSKTIPGLTEPKGLGINQATGHVYVATGNTVTNFTSEGIVDPSHPTLTGATFYDPLGVAVDNSEGPNRGDIYVSDAGPEWQKEFVDKFNPAGEFLETFVTYSVFTASNAPAGGFVPYGMAVNSRGDVFWANAADARAEEFSPSGQFLGEFTSPRELGYSLGVAVNSFNDVFVADVFKGLKKFNEKGECINYCDQVDTPSNGIVTIDSGDVVYSGEGAQVAAINSFGEVIERFGAGILSGATGGIGVNNATGTVYVSDPGTGTLDLFDQRVPTVVTEGTGDVTQHSTVLRGHVDPAGQGDITGCRFEYGTSDSYGSSVRCDGRLPIAEAGGVEGEASNLRSSTVYFYRLVGFNANGVRYGNKGSFETPGGPIVERAAALDSTEQSVDLEATIEPNGLATTYQFEFGETAGYGSVAPATPTEVPGENGDQTVSVHVAGLSPGALYHFRVVASNADGKSTSSDRVFSACANTLARQQTGAASLLDCRAYELVSAQNTGGYDVESDLTPGQQPYESFPDAESPARVLYAIHSGAIPGVAGDPTNRGPDPYVATRGEHGWQTAYVGVPEDAAPSAAPFASVPSGISASLETFAFGGADGCSPCFSDGTTGVPVRTGSGALIQGMQGSLDPGPGAMPNGFVAQDLSENGTHFIFSSTSQFEPTGNTNGNVSIYDRNLQSGKTHLVSTSPTGQPLACPQGVGECHAPVDANGIAELGLSQDGTHIVVGTKAAVDGDGNAYYRLYMDVNDSLDSVELTPSASDGVLYSGMVPSGDVVYFATADRLSADDTDGAMDLYAAEVTGGGVTVSRLSTGSGGTGNSESCDPTSNSTGAHWNTLGTHATCGVVAIGGGAGIAADTGSVYFLSPELLDGPTNGVENEPNLYVAEPHTDPQFVATLSPEDPLVVDSVTAPYRSARSNIQVSPNGRYSVFASRAALTGFENAGYLEIFRYDADTQQLACVSCGGAQPKSDATLAKAGASLTEDGRVFFNTASPLSDHDLDNAEDPYEWEAGTTELISTGASAFPSSLLGVTENGRDVYFFTHDRLVGSDENGHLVKIYDARSEGGFFAIPPPPPCAASDECHGPSSPTPGPPNIKSIADSGIGNAVPKKTKHRVKHHKRHRKRRSRAHSSAGMRVTP